MISGWIGWSTYIRKMPSGRYEFGFVKRSDNFRKRADTFVPAGIKDSVSEAEAAREDLVSLHQHTEGEA